MKKKIKTERIVSLKGTLNGIRFSEEEIENAKKSLFKDNFRKINGA